MITDNIPFYCHPDSINISVNKSLRIKVTNRCPFECNFCHHEGSIDTTDLKINKTLIDTLTQFYHEHNLREIHLTGGEPTAYPHCIKFIKKLKAIGYTVKMTSNGQFKTSFLKKLKDAGLSSINFSVHTLDPVRLAKIQKSEKSVNWGKRALKSQKDNLKESKRIGLRAKINSVVQNKSDILEVIEFCKNNGIELRILDDLNPGSLSVQKIIEILKSMRSKVTGMNVSEKASGYSFNIVSHDGFECRVKAIRKNTLKTLCNDCSIRDKCKEWFYGIRLEQLEDKLLVRLCIHRKDPPAVQEINEFFGSNQFSEIFKN